MLALLSVSQRELEAATKWLKWVANVPNSQPHTLILVVAKRLTNQSVVGLATLAKQTFASVEAVRQQREDESPWPRNANAMFACGAEYVREKHQTPFLWLEVDAIPMRHNWLDIIESEYKARGKPFMGALYKHPIPHLNGVMVYPSTLYRINPAIFVAGNKPWDLVSAEKALHLGFNTGLIVRSLKDPAKNEPHSFPTQESLRIIPNNCVLFHGCKDGTLIDRLSDGIVNVRDETSPAIIPHEIPETRLKLDGVTIWAASWSKDASMYERTLKVLKYCDSIISCAGITLFHHLPLPADLKFSNSFSPIDIECLNWNKWNRFVNREAPRFLRTEFAMAIHEDGFPLKPELWEPAFLSYDYIGAPWKDGIVGNGGFCIESQRLLKEKLTMPVRQQEKTTPADLYICRNMASYFTSKGIRFAPTEIALRFSTETIGGDKPSFGFHGRERSKEKYTQGWEVVDRTLAVKTVVKASKPHQVFDLEKFIKLTTTENRVKTFTESAKRILSSGTKNMIETGCFRGSFGDGSSTLILAMIARAAGAHLDSYELEPKNIEASRSIIAKHGLSEFVTFHQGDSVTALAKRTKPIGFAYLDSFDCGIGNNRPSQEHQLAELEAILPLLEKRAIVLLDDNVEGKGGKTKLSIERLHRRGFKCVEYGYQVLFDCKDTTSIPKSKFAVICGHLESFVPLAIDTIYKNKAIYCAAHGYDLRIERFIRKKFSDPKSHAAGFSWSRMEAMRDLLASGKFEWVWCIGGDTLVTNMTVTLESLVEEFGKHKHVLLCGERVAPVQADSFLIRASKEGIGYLDGILGTYEQYKHDKWVENQAMIDTREKYADVIQIVPQHRMNSYQYGLYSWFGPKNVYASGTDCYGNRGEWKEGDFVLHWAGVIQAKRLELVKTHEPKVIPPHPKVAVVYTRVLGKGTPEAPPPEYYQEPTERFLRTYVQFKPTVPHELLVVNCNPGKPDSMFDGVATDYIAYHGRGWDCGTWQHVAHETHYDLVICFNSFAYLWRNGWIEPFIKAFQEFGPGLYGPTASWENLPHLRTPCMAFTPSVLAEYPLMVNSRQMAVEAESGKESFTMWALKQKWDNKPLVPVKMVTEAGTYDYREWRTPPNIFRRGDQSNCLVWDRHTDIYAKASPEEKAALARASDTPLTV